jgi:hypothetical protein
MLENPVTKEAMAVAVMAAPVRSVGIPGTVVNDDMMLVVSSGGFRRLSIRANVSSKATLP